jgi:hypothetical protein
MILPLTNSEKVQKYESILANNNNWVSTTTSVVKVGDVIVPCAATGTQGTAAAGDFVIPAGAATSASTGLLGVVVAVRQRGGQTELSSITSATVGSANTTSSTPYVVEWISCRENIDWIADIGSAVSTSDKVNSYSIANSSGGTDSGTLTAATFGSTGVFNGYKALQDSAGNLKKVVGRFILSTVL